jgi:hypothetical protein
MGDQTLGNQATSHAVIGQHDDVLTLVDQQLTRVRLTSRASGSSLAEA